MTWYVPVLAVLLVEEVAERRVRQELHRRGIPAGRRPSDTVHLHRRFAEERVGPERALRHCHLVRLSADVDRRVRRREGPERGVV